MMSSSTLQVRKGDFKLGFNRVLTKLKMTRVELPSQPDATLQYSDATSSRLIRVAVAAILTNAVVG